MEPHGFIRDMLDVKMLILFVASLARYPMTHQKIYELCFQDDSLSYFDLSIAVPQLVESGHLAEIAEDHYVITDKGRDAEEVTEDSVAYPVRERARAAVARFNEEARRDGLVQAQIAENEHGELRASVTLRDETGELMTLSLPAQSQQQARMLEKSLRARADRVYQAVMGVLLEKERAGENADL